MQKEALPSNTRPRFYEICQRHNLDFQAMQALAVQAGVPKQVVDHMAVSVAVRRMHTISVLAALSEFTGQSWDLENVKVVLLPTFADLHALHQFDLAILSTTSGISFDRISLLLRDEPIFRWYHSFHPGMVLQYRTHHQFCKLADHAVAQCG